MGRDTADREAGGATGGRVSDLQTRLLKAHAQDDRLALVGLYEEAAETAREIGARCFFLTHAYVFALDAGDKRALALREALIAEGREPPEA